MHQKFQMNGIHGYILLKTKLRTYMSSKNLIGKNLTNQIWQVQIKRIAQKAILMHLKKNIKLGKIKIQKIFYLI